MVAKRVVPHGGTIRPVVGPALMTIDRSICKTLGVVSLSVEVYDCEDARKGVPPRESDPRIPFPVSALVVDSLAYEVILGHDFLSHFELDIRYSDSPTRIIGRWPSENAPRIPWFTEHPVQAANLSSRVQVYAPCSKEPDGNDEVLNDSFDLSCPEYLPAAAGRKVAVMPFTDAELRDKGLPLLSDVKPSILASARPEPGVIARQQDALSSASLKDSVSLVIARFAGYHVDARSTGVARSLLSVPGSTPARIRSAESVLGSPLSEEAPFNSPVGYLRALEEVSNGSPHYSVVSSLPRTFPSRSGARSPEQWQVVEQSSAPIRSVARRKQPAQSSPLAGRLPCTIRAGRISRPPRNFSPRRYTSSGGYV